MDEQAHCNGVKFDFTRPGKPTDNACTESFNGEFRLEGLNQNRFASLADARSKVEASRRQYSNPYP